MDDEYPVGRVAPLDVLAQDIVGRTGPFALRTDRQQAAPLVGHDQPLVLVNDPQHRMPQQLDPPPRENGHLVPRRKRMIEPGNDPAVHLHLIVRQIRFDGRPVAGTASLKQKRQQRALSADAKTFRGHGISV